MTYNKYNILYMCMYYIYIDVYNVYLHILCVYTYNINTHIMYIMYNTCIYAYDIYIYYNILYIYIYIYIYIKWARSLSNLRNAYFALTCLGKGVGTHFRIQGKALVLYN
jgi:hypothetical protein